MYDYEMAEKPAFGLSAEKCRMSNKLLYLQWLYGKWNEQRQAS